jgi:hypothetical protein
VVLLLVCLFAELATGHLRFNVKTSTLYGSTNADSNSEFSVVLTGVKSLVVDDFIF